MKCTVTLTDKILPGRVRLTSKLPDGQIMRFNRGDGSISWSGELDEKIVSGLARDGFKVSATTKKKAKE